MTLLLLLLVVVMLVLLLILLCLSIVAASLSKHEQNEQGCGASPTDPVQQAGPGTNSCSMVPTF